MSIKTGKELAAAAKAVASNHKTLYIMGCFGAPMSAKNKDRYSSNHSYNRQPARTAKIKAASAATFGFDCCGLIKGLLWGWDGDTGATYGGASYTANGVPDYGADKLIQICSGVTSDFSHIEVGEAVWNSGHIGIYIGNGLAVESTHAWKDGVQITAVRNIGTKDGYNGRKWTKHGKLPYVSYTGEIETKPAEKPFTGATSKKGDYTLEMRNLKNGCKGEDVKALQILLNGRDYNCGSPDGTFGAKTENAVRTYQNVKKLAVDGIAGEKTMRSLMGL